MSGGKVIGVSVGEVPLHRRNGQPCVDAKLFCAAAKATLAATRGTVAGVALPARAQEVQMTPARTRRSRLQLIFALAGGMAIVGTAAHAQLIDRTLTPNPANEGIAKSLAQQVGAGRGDVNTVGSSIYIIKRDPARSVRRGRQIFQRKFSVFQGFGPRTNDGVEGNIVADASLGAGLADSCAACHGRPRGSAGFGGDVATRPDSRDAPHLFGLGLQEMLADEITTEIRAQADAARAQCQSQGVTTQAFLRGRQNEIPVIGSIDYGRIIFTPAASPHNGTCLANTSEVRGVNPDLRVRPFFAQGGTISIREFLVGAFNAEMGLESPDPDLLAASAGDVVTTPAGMVLDGTRDAIEAPPVSTTSQDGDGDGVVNEIPEAIVDHMEFYLLNYFKPARGRIDNDVLQGEIMLTQFRCTNCHVKDLTIRADRRAADVETVFNPGQGNPFNRLFASAALKLVVVPDTGTPAVKNPARQPFVVRNIHSDFKRHNMGKNFAERGYNSTPAFPNLQTEFMTEALWGVGDTPPYGHDGRSGNLDDVILRHISPGAEGDSIIAGQAFAGTSEQVRIWIRKYLASLILFAPDDTASNLQPTTPADPNYPQFGHGSIRLGALFNDPTDPE